MNECTNTNNSTCTTLNVPKKNIHVNISNVNVPAELIIRKKYSHTQFIPLVIHTEKIYSCLVIHKFNIQTNW